MDTTLKENKLRQEIQASVYNMVNHDDDIPLAEEVVDEIIKTIKEYMKNE